MEVPLQPHIPAHPVKGEAGAVPAELNQPVEENSQEAVQQQLGNQAESGQPTPSLSSSASFSWPD